MAKTIVMPKVGISVESCILTKWHKQKGDTVNNGDLLFSYETDKAAADEIAVESGVLLEIVANEGAEVKVLDMVAIIGEAGEDISELLMTQVKESVPTKQGTKAQTNVASSTINVEYDYRTRNDEVKISPRAKALAEKIGVDYRYIKGSGPEERVIERDILAAKESGILFTKPALTKDNGTQNTAGSGIGGRITSQDISVSGNGINSDVEIVKLNNIRQVIAKSVLYSLSSMAQLTNSSSFDATSVISLRNKLKTMEDSSLNGITMNDIILYAVSRCLKNHRDLNPNLVENEMYYFQDVNLGIAVDTSRGLLVPTLFKADSLTLPELSRKAKELIDQAQSGNISPDLLRGAGFTVTNLGSLGVESFTPIINAPQTGILGVCAIVERVKNIDGTIKTYPAMGVSLSYDHRVIDGAPAARFIKELKEYLENFSEFLAEQGERYE